MIKKFTSQSELIYITENSGVSNVKYHFDDGDNYYNCDGNYNIGGDGYDYHIYNKQMDDVQL